MGAAISPQAVGRWIAILILISLVFGGFGEMYVSGHLVAPGDAGATARNIEAHQTLFRLGYAAYVVEGLCDATLTALLYLLLRPAGHALALIALLMRIVATAAFAAAESFYYAVLPILGGAAYLKAFPLAQIDALALLALKLYGGAGVVPTLFYGVAWVLLGRLIAVSGYLPKWLGLLLMLGGLSFAIGMFAIIVLPAWSSPFFLLPMIVAMFVLALYLLLRGVDNEAWTRVSPNTGARQ